MISITRITLALGLVCIIIIPVLAEDGGERRPDTLDLRAPMTLAANAIPGRLDATRAFRPFFLIQGKDGVPHSLARMDWDVGDMTGRYLETLINARAMGITSSELSLAEERLGRYLLSVIGPDGVVHIPDTGNVDHMFAQGSALFGLLAWYEDSGSAAARSGMDRMIRGLRALAEDHGDYLTYASVKLEQSSGSHLAGYQIFPLVRYYELTGSAEALSLAEGLTRWAVEHDPTIGPDGEILKALSWEGHVHSWFETMAGAVRAARVSPRLDHAKVLSRARAIYDWVKRTNGSDFGWYATFPTFGSCETCGIGSAVRLLLELAQSGHPEYLNDIERCVRNQVIEAQFRNPAVLARKDITVCPSLLGTFDSQSHPNSHLGQGGFEDVGTVEGCCLNGGARAIFLAWENIVTGDMPLPAHKQKVPASRPTDDMFINLAISRDSPWAEVIGYQPYQGRVDVRLHQPAPRLHVRVPDWVDHKRVTVLVDGQPDAEWSWSASYVVLSDVGGQQVVSISYPLRRTTENVNVGGKPYRITWRGDTVIAIDPPGERDKLYQRAAMDTDVVPMIAVGQKPPPQSTAATTSPKQTPHESTRVDISAAVAKFAPGWMVKDCGAEMSPGIRDELGKKNVLVTHPLSETMPCVMGRRVDIVPDKKTTLHLEVGHHPDGDWLLSVTADRELVRKVIGMETAPDGWTTIDVDLSSYAGQIITLQLINAANGWSHEEAYWARIEIE